MTDAMLPDKEPIPNSAGLTEAAPLEGTEDDELDLGERFDPKQRMLLMALVSDPDVRAAANAAGVSRRTAHRWLSSPLFQDELTRQRDAVLSDAMAGVKTQAVRAATALGKLLESKDDRVRRMVCNDILNHAIRVREVEDFERRLNALEAALERKGQEDKA